MLFQWGTTDCSNRNLKGDFIMELVIGQFEKGVQVRTGLTLVDLIDRGHDTLMVKFSKNINGTCSGIGVQEGILFFGQFPETQTYKVSFIRNGAFCNPVRIQAEVDNSITAKKGKSLMDQLRNKPSEASQDGAKTAPSADELEKALALVKQSQAEIKNGQTAAPPAKPKK